MLDDYTLTIERSHIGVFAVALFFGASFGYFGGAFHTKSSLQSAYEGAIQKDNHEVVMIDSAIGAYNASIKQYEKNNSEAALELTRQGSMTLWSLMWSYNRSQYEPIFRKVVLKCHGSKEEDSCVRVMRSAIDNLEALKKNKEKKLEQKKKSESGVQHGGDATADAA